MGDTPHFLSNFFKVLTKTAGNRKLENSEGNEKHSKIQNAAALPEEIHLQFSLAEIKAATRNFDQDLVIGRGGFGKVYKGIIDDGDVAIKHLDPTSASGQGGKEFQTEVLFQCQLRHHHLVPLIGFCCEKEEMILVYKYMRNGTLRDHLYGLTYDPLPWKQRLELCIGAARGLHYLHTGLKNARIIHRDIKSSNVLLDESWVCKLSDFGSAKKRSLAKTKALEKMNTGIKGSFGYLDPEYFIRHALTEKSDVYSFGVVLFEVLCARAVIDGNLDADQVDLTKWARSCLAKGTIHRIIDPYLIGRIAPESFQIFVNVAYSCISDLGLNRPDMGEVEVMLELALEMQEKHGSETVQLDTQYESWYEDLSFPDPGFSVESTYTSIISSNLESLDGSL